MSNSCYLPVHPRVSGHVSWLPLRFAAVCCASTLGPSASSDDKHKAQMHLRMLAIDMVSLSAHRIRNDIR